VHLSEKKEMKKVQLLGKWKILEVGDWSQADIDEFSPAVFELQQGGEGTFRFLELAAVIDWEEADPGEFSRIEFSWKGLDDRAEESGRGWAAVNGEELVGEILIFKGDHYPFRAVRSDHAGHSAP
jgi:hypothetical protein